MRRKFNVEKDGETIYLCVREPEHSDIEISDQYYAAKVASLMRKPKDQRPLLRDQLEKYLKDEGIWTEEDQNKIDELNEEVSEGLKKLRKGGITDLEGRELAIGIFEKRNQIANIRYKRRIFDEATIEAMSEQEKLDYLTYSCTVYEDSGNPYWSSFEEMKSDKGNEIFEKASQFIYEIAYGIDSDFEKKLPENRWLKKYNFLDEDLNFIDRKTGKNVDRGYRAIEESEEGTNDFNALDSDITEEEPFIDSETNEPISAETEESE